MSVEKIDRKISVIFATDVVDYSLHMEKDESGTVTSLRTYEKILKEAFKKHGDDSSIQEEILFWPSSLVQ